MSPRSGFKVVEMDDVLAADRVSVDRPDYTQETIDVDVTIAQERASDVTYSSTTPIGAGSVNAYSTGWFRTGNFNKLVGTLYCNYSCTIYIEGSIDGETMRTQQTQSYTNESTSIVLATWSYEINAPYMRLRVECTVATKIFEVWTKLSTGA